MGLLRWTDGRTRTEDGVTAERNLAREAERRRSAAVSVSTTISLGGSP